MAIQVQLRRGTAAQNNAFTGAIGELSFDTTANQVRVHDGSTAGGFKIGVGDFPTGTNNVALGNTALDDLDGVSPGGNNTAVGHDALTANTTASFNTAIGVSAGSLITTGQKNTILGSFDGNEGGLDIRTSNNHIVLSDGDGNPRLIIDDSGNVDIGHETTELKLKNTTHEDTDGGRESKITFQGEQSGGEQSVLAQIQASHDGTSDDEKGDLIFKTNDGSDGASPTERMRIDSSGNVGIGTSSPTQKLSVEGNIQSTGQFYAGSTGAATPDYAFAADTSLGMFRIPGALGFSTGGTERMRIESNGAKNFGAHTSGSAGYNLYVGAADTGSFACRLDGVGTGSSNVVQFVNGFGNVGTITLSGASTAYNTSSDHRLKENVTDVTDGITRIKQLAPKRFNFIANPDTTVDGFIAHEAQTVVPEAVTGTHDAMRDEEYEVTPAVLDEDGNVVTEAVMGTRSVPVYQGIDQSKLVPLLTAALQEAIAKIETLETQNTTQATQIADLITRVEALEAG